MQTNVYIDASNLFYGGKKSLGWSIDYKKLYDYLKNKYQAKQIFFFGGIEIYKFPFDYLAIDSVPVKDVEKYIVTIIKERGNYLDNKELNLLDTYLKRIRFYITIEKFGYTLILKPVKTFFDSEGVMIKKANCDVDMTFFLMKDRSLYNRAIILSGDGDFLPVLKYLRDKDRKEIFILAHTSRTAKEIKKFAAEKFLDFAYLRERLRYKNED